MAVGLKHDVGSSPIAFNSSPGSTCLGVLFPSHAWLCEFWVYTWTRSSLAFPVPGMSLPWILCKVIGLRRLDTGVRESYACPSISLSTFKCRDQDTLHPQGSPTLLAFTPQLANLEFSDLPTVVQIISWPFLGDWQYLRTVCSLFYLKLGLSKLHIFNDQKGDNRRKPNSAEHQLPANLQLVS